MKIIILLALALGQYSVFANHKQGEIVVIRTRSSANLKNNIFDQNHKQIEELALKNAGSSLTPHIHTRPVIESIPGLGIDRIILPAGVSIEQAKAIYGNSKYARIVEENFIYKVDPIGIPTQPTSNHNPNDEEFIRTWNLKKIQAQQAWQIPPKSTVVVAIVDTGIDYNHPDLKDNMWTDPNNHHTHGFNAIDRANILNPMDDKDHGTHVAGTVAAVKNDFGATGIDFGAKLMGIKVLNQNGTGESTDISYGLYYIAIKRFEGVNVRVINMSLAGYKKSYAIETALQILRDKGVLVVAAASNEASVIPAFPASYPLDNIISVAATDSNDKLAEYSNRGLYVDLAAPGDGIFSTLFDQYPGYRVHNYGSLRGTSMASPHVAGVASLVFSHYPNIRYQDVRERILNSTDFLENLWGVVNTSGRLNALKAIQPYLVLPNSPTQFTGAKPRKFKLDPMGSGEPALVNSMQWSVSDPTLAAISPTGELTALKEGMIKVSTTDSSNNTFHTSMFPIRKLELTELSRQSLFSRGGFITSSYLPSFSIEFLENSFLEPENVSLSVVSNPPPFPPGTRAVGPTLALSPIDTPLLREAIIRIDSGSIIRYAYDKQNISVAESDLHFFVYNSDYSRWEEIPSTPDQAGRWYLPISKLGLFTFLSADLSAAKYYDDDRPMSKKRVGSGCGTVYFVGDDKDHNDSGPGAEAMVYLMAFLLGILGNRLYFVGVRIKK